MGTLARSIASPNAFLPKQLFQPFDYVVLVGVDREDLALAAPRELGFHFFDQCPLFGIRFVPVQINRFGNDKRFPASWFPD